MCREHAVTCCMATYDARKNADYSNRETTNDMQARQATCKCVIYATMLIRPQGIKKVGDTPILGAGGPRALSSLRPVAAMNYRLAHTGCQAACALPSQRCIFSTRRRLCLPVRTNTSEMKLVKLENLVPFNPPATVPPAPTSNLLSEGLWPQCLSSVSHRRVSARSSLFSMTKYSACAAKRLLNGRFNRMRSKCSNVPY